MHESVHTLDSRLAADAQSRRFLRLFRGDQRSVVASVAHKSVRLYRPSTVQAAIAAIGQYLRERPTLADALPADVIRRAATAAAIEAAIAAHPAAAVDYLSHVIAWESAPEDERAATRAARKAARVARAVAP